MAIGDFIVAMGYKNGILFWMQKEYVIILHSKLPTENILLSEITEITNKRRDGQTRFLKWTGKIQAWQEYFNHPIRLQ